MFPAANPSPAASAAVDDDDKLFARRGIPRVPSTRGSIGGHFLARYVAFRDEGNSFSSVKSDFIHDRILGHFSNVTSALLT